ncbi:ISAs1 family transposase [Rubripirellula reticaptiva]|uniref:Transposase DDE domain protein n=1 Tax=Rubripirellula reticaptiva TaxID=2528013 RepID=A0A5C6EBK0_9BACT|nr:ISAs1 family transposase [Rubripirellula reticaptiva]TWU47143.1 Transposase DDE domain protein [Rubripirellula reticaptiva]
MNGPAAIVSKSFVNVTDPRLERGHNHDLLEMIFITLTATICGANSWTDVERFANGKIKWFRRYTKLDNGVPSHDTLGRVFSRLDTDEFLTAMHHWVDQFAGSLRGKGVAIDGKVLRGSFDRAAGQSPLHTMTAFASETRLVIRQLSVDDKSNEIPAVPKLLELMEIEGAVITLDAMHCQKETAKAITDKKAEYILTVKGNQQKLAEAIGKRFVAYGELDNQVEGLRRHVTVEKSHGREERREYFCIAIDDDEIFDDWAGAKTIGMIYRHREGNVAEHDETMFFISSLPPKVKRLSKFIRDHWKIENSEHYVLDVTFAEDASRIRRGTSPEISAAIRRMALNILQRDTTVKDNIRGKRMRAGWDDAVLDGIYAGFNRT